jgi:hypothetical protein
MKENGLKDEILARNGMNSQSQDMISFLDELDHGGVKQKGPKREGEKKDQRITKLIQENDKLKKKNVGKLVTIV